jgi:hypothetical protein
MCERLSRLGGVWRPCAIIIHTLEIYTENRRYRAGPTTQCGTHARFKAAPSESLCSQEQRPCVPGARTQGHLVHGIPLPPLLLCPLVCRSTLCVVRGRVLVGSSSSRGLSRHRFYHQGGQHRRLHALQKRLARARSCRLPFSRRHAHSGYALCSMRRRRTFVRRRGGFQWRRRRMLTRWWSLRRRFRRH